jgi:MFS transporter, DHA1 family, inner membrane transport protein
MLLSGPGAAVLDRPGRDQNHLGPLRKPWKEAPVVMSPSTILFLCMFAGQAGVLVLSPMLPEVARDLGVATATAGQLRSVSGAVAGIVALGLGLVASRFGVRDLLLTGLGLLGGGALISAFAPGFTLLLVAQIPIGAGLALVLGGALSAAAEWAPVGRRSRVLSWALMGPPAAWVLGMPVAGAISDVSWRAAWLAVPFAASLAAGLAVLGRPPDRPQRTVAHPWRRAWRRPGVAGWAVGELLAYSAWTGTIVYGGALFIEVYGLSAGRVGVVLAAVAVAYMPGNYLARRWVDTGARWILLSFALASAVVVTVLVALKLGAIPSLVAFGVLAFLAGGRTLAGSAFGLDAAPAEKVVVMSLRAAGLQFGYFFGAALGGLALAAGGYRALGVLLAALYLLAATPHLAAILRRRQRVRLTKVKIPFFRDDELRRETERFARMTPEQRLALFLELCDLTDSIQRDRPDAEALRRPAPRSPESESLWKRLMAEHRRHG